ncbi:192_t:CDS:2 [Paraglomus brasilianum]|uniref:192_t:CDS:1 n=1 Tax=Paraglomus brasilianum TaxID=144538 RepID=A0A9N9F8M4_9GLOM|nr:192_t:CDS:2 [Paraglomus brasilianum]
MALAPHSAGHRYGLASAPHVLEAYLDYVCPFSARLFKKLHTEIFPYINQKYPDKVQFIFRQQIQAWHPVSAIVNEAALAVEKLNPSKFYEFSAVLYEAQKQYFDEVTYTQSRAQIHESLSKLAGSVGVSPEEFLKLLRVGDADNPRNYGNGVTAELKYHIKLGRQNGVHVSPTVLFDGLIVPNNDSDGWTYERFKEWLDKTLTKT